MAIEDQARRWRENFLSKINDTLTICSGKVIDEIHFYRQPLVLQQFKLFLIRTGDEDVINLHERMSNFTSIEGFHYEQTSTEELLFGILHIMSNRFSIGKVIVYTYD